MVDQNAFLDDGPMFLASESFSADVTRIHDSQRTVLIS